MMMKNWKIEKIQIKISVFLGILIGTTCFAYEDAKTPVTLAIAPDPEAIGILPHDSFNLSIDDIINDSQVVVKLNTPCHNYFGANFKNLPRDKQFTIGLSMDFEGNKENIADVSKWQSLVPQYTYGDVTNPATYEWYRKNAKGYWENGNPLLIGNAKYAGNARLPEQKVIPAAEAEDCLSADGNYWEPWCNISNTEVDKQINIYRMKMKFKESSATIAMRIPCVNAVSNDFLSQLREVKPKNCDIYNIGKSTYGRDLNVVVLRDPAEFDQQKLINRPTIVFYAEDGNEHDANWINYGILRFLVSKDPVAAGLLKKVNVLILPAFDPDGIARSTWANLTKSFVIHHIKDTIPAEILAYTRFFDSWIEQGNRLDIICGLHCVECSETTSNILCPIINLRRNEAMVAMNNYIMDQIKGYKTSKDIWMKGFMDNRLCGWCAKLFGCIDCQYETNGKLATNRLNLAQLQGLGIVLVTAFVSYTGTANFAKLQSEIDNIRNHHRSLQKAYWMNQKTVDHEHSPYQSIVLGF